MAGSPRDPLPGAVLTRLTQLSALVLSVIILLPVRPSRENVTSMPRLRRNVCARRSRPARVRGFLAHPLPLEMSGGNSSEHKSQRSDVIPVHMVLLAMIARIRLA